jgi:hypothetical protein
LFDSINLIFRVGSYATNDFEVVVIDFESDKKLFIVLGRLGGPVDYRCLGVNIRRQACKDFDFTASGVASGR